MNHREEKYRGNKTRTEPLGHPIHGQTSMFNSMNCLILKVRGIHALKPFPSVPAALDQGHTWSKLKKNCLGHQHWTWPDDLTGTETGRWQKQKFKQKRQAVSRQLQPCSELGRHPIWKRHGTLVGSGFLAWLRGVHGVEPVELLTWTLGDSWWILGALGEPPPNSSQNCVCRIITQPPTGRECPAVTSESPQYRKTMFPSIHC